MKSNLKFLAIIAFLGLFMHSCSSDDDNSIAYNADINPERFENIEIGNTNFKVPQFNPDLHTEFEYTGKSKVKKIYYDINPVNVSEPGVGEAKWQVSDHLIPEKHYAGQLNPHIHYHVFFDPVNENFPKIRPAKGIYSLKIRIVEEDNSESLITKEFEIVKKFTGVKIGNDNHIKIGSDELDIEFQYDAESNTVSEIKYQMWFEEWREGQNVPIGDWDNVVIVLPENLYKNQNKPHVKHNMPIEPDSPLGDYWLNIYVKESGESEAVKLSVPFSIVK
ncbi:hypothetical protein ATE84_2432 [Aquimarina sp. MAR_2010_214]|uniref:hypothetical protein n=1 Tax=Aquimarina sp. MAR_2010_214 TaxID=1250026 RepID=UPI000C6FDD6E|nr:hypothetical protein [Aquimarina sp. MAR_2010_214]PKV50375.1 hypothetical protein ATE84_2432 [Aquimarina sp. MAR_2010_214]